MAHFTLFKLTPTTRATITIIYTRTILHYYYYIGHLMIPRRVLCVIITTGIIAVVVSCAILPSNRNNDGLDHADETSATSNRRHSSLIELIGAAGFGSVVTAVISVIMSKPNRSKPSLSSDEQTWRKEVLKRSLQYWTNNHKQLKKMAKFNLDIWRMEAEQNEAEQNGQMKVLVESGDWGDVTLRLTKKFGTTFAVLNMANQKVAGGGFLQGMVAQEENMFRRTDCYFSLFQNPTPKEDMINLQNLHPKGLHKYVQWREGRFKYNKEHESMIESKGDTMYLDKKTPRVCFVGSENPQDRQKSYQMLQPKDVFQFYELRSAAKDLRTDGSYDETDMRTRITNQFEKLKKEEIRHVVLSAFGCGAFRNPADKVAAIYKELIEDNIGKFDVIAFAIYNAGYGPGDNFSTFKTVLENINTQNNKNLQVQIDQHGIDL